MKVRFTASILGVQGGNVALAVGWQEADDQKKPRSVVMVPHEAIEDYQARLDAYVPAPETDLERALYAAHPESKPKPQLYAPEEEVILIGDVEKVCENGDLSLLIPLPYANPHGQEAVVQVRVYQSLCSAA